MFRRRRAAAKLSAFLDAKALDQSGDRYAPDHEGDAWQVRDRATGRMLTDRELLAVPFPELLTARLPTP